jgi:hypothetical protein
MEQLRCATLRDTALPRLWSDTELVRYLNQAQIEFAVRTHELVDDTTTSACKITTISGQAVYPLHKSVVIVAEAGVVTRDSATQEETGYTPLHDRTRGQLPRAHIKGCPARYTAQVRTSSIRFSPIPDAAYDIELVVARKPLYAMDKGNDVPEISEEYHLALVDFAAFRALTNNNPEGANMASATDFKALWDVAVRDAKRAIATLRAGENPQARGNWTGKQYRRYT